MIAGAINILMTGGGAPGAAGILHCLRQNPAMNITVADANPNAIGRYLNSDFETIPMGDNAGFADAVMSLCRKKNIHVVMPLVTRELIPLSTRFKEFEDAGIRVIVSPAECLEIANNKSRLYEFLQWRGLKVPGFRIVETIEQFISAAGELGYPARDICFKPSVANGSRGFRIISGRVDELDLLFNHKPTSVYMRMDEATRVLSSGSFPQLLVSEYLPGEEYSVDCLAEHGNPLMVLPRLRKKMINGISVEGEFVKEENIIDYCQQVVGQLQLHGVVGLQVKRSTGGEFLLLEINPRVQGTISAGLGAGVNLPVLAVKQALALPISPAEMQVKWGTRFSRYWAEVFYE